MDCKICGEPMEYTGLDDGGGDYGDSVCDQWHCDNCDYDDESGCFGGEDDFSTLDADGHDFDEPYPTEDDPIHLFPPYNEADPLPF